MGPNPSLERERQPAALVGSLRGFAAPATPHLKRWALKVLPSYLAAVPGMAVNFGSGPEWPGLKRKSQECCG